MSGPRGKFHVCRPVARVIEYATTGSSATAVVNGEVIEADTSYAPTLFYDLARPDWVPVCGAPIVRRRPVRRSDVTPDRLCGNCRRTKAYAEWRDREAS